MLVAASITLIDRFAVGKPKQLVPWAVQSLIQGTSRHMAYACTFPELSPDTPDGHTCL